MTATDTTTIDVDDPVHTEAAAPPSAAEEVERLEKELAALEFEVRFGRVEDARAAQRDLREAGNRNNPSLMAEARERLRRNVWRNNEILVQLLPMARIRLATAECRERASRRETFPAMSAAELAEATAQAEANLSALTREYAGLPGLLRDAADTADADALTGRRRRLDELPGLVMAAQATLLRLQIADFESQEVEAKADQPAAFAKMEAARAVFEKAQAAYVTAKSEHNSLIGTARTAVTDAGEYRLRLARLLEEQSIDRGPIVRSRIHAGRGLGNG
jgi:hypothetical protein